MEKKIEKEKEKIRQKEKYKLGKEYFMNQVKLFLENNDEINKALKKLKYAELVVIKKLDYYDYECQYIENLCHKIKKEENVLLNGCILASNLYVYDRIESNEFLGTRLIIYYPKNICNIM